ncbi:hypothetical protein PtA15_2A310 [Puccinia triticina]|uniref:Uncharacterized protein n=1 Tax=Puccinia triticina TaxID=208348 RepID=A0ABY7CC09_9BASI|nr:uncharacterized protein PtA15_2A310 [Puccinia triticina]WAQ81997.1 hypothetical protein PtA15_2A310 [Puccinia triticina]
MRIRALLNTLHASSHLHPALYPHFLATTPSETPSLFTPGSSSLTSPPIRLSATSKTSRQTLSTRELNNSVFVSQPVKEAEGKDELSI